ncbi:hypothetical protein [Rossellomorea yichunensis]|jgi:hypothetical protein|uniref:hypothetical protein n=1 Tax=Rossellomorea yichunensis TaxID=3077331 RepID=UPI0028E00E9A|nr:hypothetical protein [Rossellomorea sp. YC4-1]MDT9025530.1 hypothetical protein [Rossellomorea sp. YC4-1]
MMSFFIFIGILVLYFAIRIWIGSRKMEFYGDSIKNTSRNARDEAYEKSARHSQQAMNSNHHSGGGSNG